MSDDTTPGPATEPDEPAFDEAGAQAVEYALGLLDAQESAAAAARMRAEPVFAAEVRAWQERLARLAADLPQVPPHYTVKKRLDARLFAAPARRGLGLRGWLAAALTAAAVAVAALVIAPTLMAPQADRIAELSVPDRGLRITTAFHTDASAVEVTLAEGPAPADGDLEVWWISPDAAPVSLGLAPHDGTVTLPLPRDVAAHAADAQGVTIALSSEPRGGSPTGQPTGPVLATAPLTTL